MEPSVITEYVTKTEYRYAEVPVLKYVDQVVELPYEQQPFESIEYLREFLAKDGTNKPVIRLVADGSEWDCEDYAIQLQKRALKAGFLMSIDIVDWREYNSLFTENQLSYDTKHAINSTIIGNWIYYIEPQTDEVCQAYRLD
ncbi:MAG: hypothetical protein JSV32_00960 [Dehalococcoidia bacterium]|nr:MAG: hypothetical protein JSV32_00960 [Dehalococcoidia bacterium]